MTYCRNIFHFHVCDQRQSQELAIDKEVKFHILVILWNQLGKINVQVSLFIWYHQEWHHFVTGSGKWSQEEFKKHPNINNSPKPNQNPKINDNKNKKPNQLVSSPSFKRAAHYVRRII